MKYQARQYAIALSDILKTEDAIQDAVVALRAVKHAYEEHKEIRSFFESPVIAFEKKKTVLRGACKDLNLPESIFHVLLIMIQSFDLHKLSKLIYLLKQIEHERFGSMEIKVQSPRPISPETKKILEEHFRASPTQRVLIHERMNPDLLGGFVVRVKDTILDLSIKARLQRLS